MPYVRQHAVPGLVLAATVQFLAPAAQAQQSVDTAAIQVTQDSHAGGSQWGIGLAVGGERKAYRDYDDKLQGVPLIMYVNQYVSILGPSIDVHLPSAGPVLLRLRAKYSLDGYEADDSPYLAGMEERKGSFWLGGVAIWRTGIADLSAEFLTDGSGHSEGSKFKLQIDRRFDAGAFALTPRVAAQRVDEEYVDYYYGVRHGEIRIDRARYEGVAATNVEIGMRVDYAIAKKQNVFIDLSATRLGTGIRHSPLAARPRSSAIMAGYLYRF